MTRRVTRMPATQGTLLFLILLVTLVGTTSAAGGDCMSGNIIDCFECNTWDDPRCADPFNYTLHKEDMPLLKECEGCCVKMVQFIGTEHYQIKRTCTDNFEVNFFMVNHACMTEGHRHGHMCFCEEDECNASVVHRAISPCFVLLVGFSLLIHSNTAATIS